MRHIICNGLQARLSGDIKHYDFMGSSLAPLNELIYQRSGSDYQVGEKRKKEKNDQSTSKFLAWFFFHRLEF